MDTFKTSVRRGGATKVLVLSTFLLHVLGGDENYCFGDICNTRNIDQFCSSHYQLCRNCADIVDDCGTSRQPISCTSYCTSYLVKMEVQKVQGKTCSVHRQPANGFIVPLPPKDGRFLIGTTISITCEKNYNLIGSQTMTCLGNDTWTGDAFCLNNSYQTWKIAGTVLTVVVAVLVAVLVAVSVIYCHENRCMKKTIQQEQPAKRDTDSCAESGIDVSVTVEDETSPLMIEEQTQQKPTMEDKCVGTESDERDPVPKNDTSPTYRLSADTETPSPSSCGTKESNNCPKYQPIVNTVVKVVLNQSQENSNEQQKDNAILTDEVDAYKSKEGRKRSVAEKRPTEESQITTEAIKETSGKGTEPLTPRIKSDSTPSRGTLMKTDAVSADTTETRNEDLKMIATEDRTFHVFDAQFQQ